MTAVIPDMDRGIRETEGPGRSLTGPKGSQVAAALPDAPVGQAPPRITAWFDTIAAAHDPARIPQPC